MRYETFYLLAQATFAEAGSGDLGRGVCPSKKNQNTTWRNEGFSFVYRLRKNEFEADAYARETYDGEQLQIALKKLSVDSLSNLYPHPAHVFMHYSHPPLLKRLEELARS